MCVYQKWQKNLNTHTHTLGNDNTHVLQERKMKTDGDGGDVAVFDDLWFLLVLRYHLIPIPSQHIPKIYTHTHIEHTHTHTDRGNNICYKRELLIITMYMYNNWEME